MEEAGIRHLEMIQGVVHRLANQAAWTRRFSLVFVATVTAGAFIAEEPTLAFLSLIAVVAWWLLDAYYLAEERNFRALFDAVRISPPPTDPFTMRRPSLGYWPVVWSRTLLLFHGPLVLIPVIGGAVLLATDTSGCS